MKPLSAKSLLFAVLSLGPFSVVTGNLRADTVQIVSNFAELTAAITSANSYGDGTYRIEFSGDISASISSGSLQQFIRLQSGSNLVIDGKGHKLDMNLQDRAFYVAEGNVSFANLTIEEGYAAGGTGGAGGGGGMGAGGAIYVANRGSGTQVSVSNVLLSNNSAQGGDGGHSDGTANAAQGGGGGGMGGNGGSGFFESGSIVSNNHDGTGGGGGFGRGADGGTAQKNNAGSGSEGAYVGGESGGDGSGNNLSGDGGTAGGGGGAAESSTYIGTAQAAAGGGGVGGSAGVRDSTSTGGQGGYGGGGGGGRNQGGAGGYGGGGGAGLESSHFASNESYGGDGGFGGGGGTGSFSHANSAGSGGFGGGNAVNTDSTNHTGGGGMGAGGAIFTEKGATLIVSDVSFAENAVTGGGSLNDLADGAALGNNVFLGGDVTYHVGTSSGEAEVSGLGGGGDVSDARIAGRDTNGDAKGGLIKTGAGTLRLGGANTYAGTTQAREGRLVEAATTTFTSGYEVSQGATLELATDDMTPAAITTEDGAVVVSASNVNLASSTFEEGTIVIDGSASGLQTTGNAMRIGGSGTLSGFADAATFQPSNLTLENTTWQNGTVFEFNLGETMLTSVGTSDFSEVNDGRLMISILLLGSGIGVGDEVELMTFADGSSFDLDKFVLTSEIVGFSGLLYQRSSGDALTLGVQVTAVPEPALTAVIVAGVLALCVLRRRRRMARRSGCF